MCAAVLHSAAACGQPLTDQPGDPRRGLEVVRDLSKASCLICHSIQTLPDRDQGEIGPALDGVGSAYSRAALRQRIIDARLVFPDTIMPPYYSTKDLYRVGKEYEGRTIYSPQDVEDVLAFLMTLKD
jgi:sulfur-oxidizing protein SoxX